MSKYQTTRKHNHEIGDKTESQLLDVFSEMIENNWREQIGGTRNPKALDIHFFHINGKYCGIVVYAKPTVNQPGNGFVSCKYNRDEKLPHAWKDLIDRSLLQNMGFVRQRYDFSRSLCKVKDIYDNVDDGREAFRSLAVNFLLTFEIARRVEPKGTYPVTKEEVKRAQGIVFNPAYYERENGTPYQEMLGKLITMFGGGGISKEQQRKAYDEIIEADVLSLAQDLSGQQISRSDRYEPNRVGYQSRNPFENL